MKKFPSVSIGLPVYNGDCFLREAIESILNQTFVDFELVISDNGSTDETEILCREYASLDKRIIYVRQDRNIGAVENYRFVLKQARGKYFMWVAADDIWDREWVEKLFTLASENQVIAMGSVKAIDEQGRLIWHPANQRILSYTGLKILRRIKFYVEPGVLGKANTIYSLALTKVFREHDVFSVHIIPGLLEWLGTYQIKSDSTTFIYKRIHRSSMSEEINKLIYGGQDRGQFRKIYDKVKEIILPTPVLYWSKLDFFEKLIFPIIYTVALVWGAIMSIRVYLSNRKRGN